MYVLSLQCYDLMRSHSTSQHISEHYRHANRSMLALSVVTAKVLIVISGSFMSKTKTGPTLISASRSPSHEHVTSVAVGRNVSQNMTYHETSASIGPNFSQNMTCNISFYWPKHNNNRRASKWLCIGIQHQHHIDLVTCLWDC